jgi:hypothetical protein
MKTAITPNLAMHLAFELLDAKEGSPSSSALACYLDYLTGYVVWWIAGWCERVQLIDEYAEVWELRELLFSVEVLYFPHYVPNHEWPVYDRNPGDINDADVPWLDIFLLPLLLVFF